MSSTTAVSGTNLSCRCPHDDDKYMTVPQAGTTAALLCVHVFIICGYDDDDKAMRGDPACCENVTVYTDISTYRK